MKQMNDYLYLIPVWMREDESFNKFYSTIITILLECQEAKDKIVESFEMSKLAEYSKSLEIIASYFGINRNFYLSDGNNVTGISEVAGSWTYSYTPNSTINISLSNETMLRLIKFKLLQSNFDGTIKNLLDNYNSLFEGEDIRIQFLEDTLLNEGTGEIYPVLNLNLVLNETTPIEEATLFLNGAYSFNYLGVKTTYSLGGKTVELIWDQSNWDQSKWKI